VSVPHFSNPNFSSDYTHRRLFGYYSFYSFAVDQPQIARKIPTFYSTMRIRVTSQRLVFRIETGRTGGVKRVLDKLIDLPSRTREFHGAYLCYISPCYELSVVFAHTND
jgi:hypothetical protein